MTTLKMSKRVLQKLLNKHDVDPHELQECFANRPEIYLEDDREQHRTNPPTRWFISETISGRKLKIVFMQDGDGWRIKSAFEPNPTEIRIFNRRLTEAR